jgi:hypothetical protein
VNPTPTDALAGLTNIETNDGEVTVKELVPVRIPSVAVTAVEPRLFPVTRPVFEIDANVAFETFQETEFVRVWLLPSL